MDNMLEYQKLDGELLGIQRDINTKSNKAESMKLIAFIKSAQQRTLEIDREANALIDELNHLKDIQVKGEDFVTKYTKQNVDDLKESELQDLDNKISKGINDLTLLENKILEHSDRVTSLLSEYRDLSKQAADARVKYQQNKAVFEKLSKENEAKILEIKGQLEKLQPTINPAIFAKYKSLRGDGIFPAIVPLTNTHCGGCRMELPSGTIEKIKEKGFLECEQCHRIIYFSSENKQ